MWLKISPCFVPIITDPYTCSFLRYSYTWSSNFAHPRILTTELRHFQCLWVYVNSWVTSICIQRRLLEALPQTLSTVRISLHYLSCTLQKWPLVTVASWYNFLLDLHERLINLCTNLNFFLLYQLVIRHSHEAIDELCQGRGIDAVMQQRWVSRGTWPCIHSANLCPSTFLKLITDVPLPFYSEMMLSLPDLGESKSTRS